MNFGSVYIKIVNRVLGMKAGFFNKINVDCNKRMLENTDNTKIAGYTKMEEKK